MFKEFSNNSKEDDYLSEFRQKIAHDMQEDMERRKRELERSRNGFVGTIAGIVLAVLVGWFLLLPHFGFSDNKEIPIIRRPILPVKIEPNNRGGMEILNQDKTVYALVEKTDEVNTKIESLLPPPEAPKMPTIVPEPEEEQISPEVEENLDEAKNIEDLISVVETTATEKVDIPQKLNAIDVKVQKASQEEIKRQEQKVVEQKEEPVEIKTATEAPVLKQTETPVLTQNAGRFHVQLMASSKKEALEQSFTDMVKKYPVLQNQNHQIEQGTTDSLYRLKVGSFKTKLEAETLCDAIKKSGGTCLIKEN